MIIKLWTVNISIVCGRKHIDINVCLERIQVVLDECQSSLDNRQEGTGKHQLSINWSFNASYVKRLCAFDIPLNQAH